MSPPPVDLVGRFDGISMGIRMVFDALGVEPQPWMGMVGLVAFLILLGPSIRRTMSSSAARKMVLGMADLPAAARAARAREILAMVEHNPEGLIGVADEALRRRQRALAGDAYLLLRKTGKRPLEQLRLDEELHGPRPRHADTEAHAIERMLESGAHAAAQARLARARSAFPDDAELRALHERLHRQAAPQADPSSSSQSSSQSTASSTDEAATTGGA